MDKISQIVIGKSSEEKDITELSYDDFLAKLNSLIVHRRLETVRGIVCRPLIKFQISFMLDEKQETDWAMLNKTFAEKIHNYLKSVSLKKYIIEKHRLSDFTSNNFDANLPETTFRSEICARVIADYFMMEEPHVWREDHGLNSASYQDKDLGMRSRQYYDDRIPRINMILCSLRGNSIVQCNIKRPWIDHICCGKKTFEARLYRDKWCSVKKGDILLTTRLVDGVALHMEDKKDSRQLRNIALVVNSVKRYEDFGKAWAELRDKLIPFIYEAWKSEGLERRVQKGITEEEITEDEVNNLYSVILKTDLATIKKCGVVVFGLS